MNKSMKNRGKKQSLDQRSKIEVEIDKVTHEMASIVEYNAVCKEALADLGVHLNKIKQYETEMGPRETEHKSVLNTFQKMLDSGTSIRSKTGKDGEESGALDGSRVVGPNGSSGTTGPAQTRPNSRVGGGSKGSDHHQHEVAPLTYQQEANDREAMRVLQHILRDNVAAVLVPLFNAPKTQVEIAREKQKDIERAEAKAVADAAAAAGSSPNRGGSAAVRKPAPKLSAAAAAAASKAECPDLELLCAPGIDIGFHEDILKLRSQRLLTESRLHAIQAQLSGSRAVVLRRRDEGYTKQGLKKSEKKLMTLTKTLAELNRIKAADDAAKARLEGGGGGAGKKKK